MATQRMRPRVEALPAELDSAQSKLVFLYLETAGGGTVSDLCDALDIPQVSLYPTLRTLCERDLVEVRDGEYRPI